ncbi:MAG: hypothetical protein ACJA1B_001348, partial [Polaribacter sp.]
MKKNILFLAITFIMIACSSIKNTQEAINKGNYNSAINIAVDNLRKNKTKKGNQPYILMLQDAYAKATSKDLSRINF